MYRVCVHDDMMTRTSLLSLPLHEPQMYSPGRQHGESRLHFFGNVPALALNERLLRIIPGVAYSHFACGHALPPMNTNTGHYRYTLIRYNGRSRYGRFHGGVRKWDGQ